MKLLFMTAIILLFWAAPATAFLLPHGVIPHPGSTWRYNSNLGPAQVEILETHVAGDILSYQWRLSVAGLQYEEELHLSADTVAVAHRSLHAFHLYHDSFSFPDTELTMHIPLHVGAEWTWEGAVHHGKEEARGHVTGHVVGLEQVTVPAGTFSAFQVALEREDDFGTKQQIMLWFNPDIGVLKAKGDLEWRGVLGKAQRLVGLDSFEVELRQYDLITQAN